MGDERRREGLIVFPSLESLIPFDHPLPAIRQLVDRVRS
jgi:hypothetical protein